MARREYVPVSRRVGAERDIVHLTLSNNTAADATFYILPVHKRCEIVAARYVQSAAATAATSYTATLRVGTTGISDALNIKGLAAGTPASWSITRTELKPGDVINIFFDETGGTVTPPGVVGIAIELLYLE